MKSLVKFLVIDGGGNRRKRTGIMSSHLLQWCRRRARKTNGIAVLVHRAAAIHMPFMPNASRSDGQRRSRCALCGKPASPAHAPFCSQGCRDRDLLNWLGDSYRVPGPPADEESAEIDGQRLDSQG
jgi:hypothetical protein